MAKSLQGERPTGGCARAKGIKRKESKIRSKIKIRKRLKRKTRIKIRKRSLPLLSYF
jgi:hypothetical protein